MSMSDHNGLMHAAEYPKQRIGRMHPFAHFVEIHLRGSRNDSRRATEANRLDSLRQLHTVRRDICVHFFLAKDGGSLIRPGCTAVRLNVMELFLHTRKFRRNISRAEKGKKSEQSNRREYL